MTDYVTKDSGERQSFGTGAVRDISTGKTRYDLIPLKALKRWGDLMERGAQKYAPRNWELGMESSRCVESGLRHFFQYLEGDRTEDHLAAVLFNVGAIIHFEGTDNDDLNEAPEPELVEWQIHADDATHEWILDIVTDDEPENEQLEWDLEPEREYVNWEKIDRDVASGKVSAEGWNWPEGHPRRTTQEG